MFGHPLSETTGATISKVSHVQEAHVYQSDPSALEGGDAAMEQSANQEDLVPGQQMVADTLVVPQDAERQNPADPLTPCEESE